MTRPLRPLIRPLGLAALAATLAVAAPAAAQPGEGAPAPSTVEVQPPGGWSLDPRLSASHADSLRAGKLGGADAAVAVAFYRTAQPGGAFIVSERTASPPPADPVAAARVELATLRGIVDAAGGTLVAWRFQGGEPTLPEARLEWRDASVGTTSITRALVIRTADALTVVTGECLLAGDDAAMRAPCEQALAALRPAAALKRVEVGMGAIDPVEQVAAAAAAGGGEPAVVDGAGGGDGVAAADGAPAATMRAGGADIPATILVRPPEQKSDRRGLMLIGGIVVLGLVFLWNRRQRSKLEAAEARERRRQAGRDPDEPERDAGEPLSPADIARAAGRSDAESADDAEGKRTGKEDA